MPITPTYPGVYIEELPSYNHSVTAAPTSVTVFIGYTHPFKTSMPGKAVQLFSFADYQTYFGGFFSFDPWLPDYVGNAVFQYFQNGGSTAWVVGLKPAAYINAGNEPVTAPPAGGNAGAQAEPVTLRAASKDIDLGTVTATFTALEPTSAGTPNSAQSTAPPQQISVQLANVHTVSLPSSASPAGQGQSSSAQTTGSSQQGTASSQQTVSVADIIITFGAQVETYRAVPLFDPTATTAAGKNVIATQLGQSGLVQLNLTPSSTGSTSATGQPDPETALADALATAAFPAPSTDNPTNSYTLSYATPPPDDSTLIYSGDYAAVFETGASLDVDVPIFNLMVLPGISPVSEAYSAVLSQALAYCEQKRAFFIMDAPPNATTSVLSVKPEATAPPGTTPAQVSMDQYWNGTWGASQQPLPVPVSPNGAIYFPYLNTIDPLTQQPSVSPPSGFVAGIYANEDTSWNVAKAPAGLETVLTGAFGVVPSGRMTDMQQGVLNNDGINCLRDFPDVGTVVFGARTLVSANLAFQQWKYVPVRRTALFIEQSLYQSLGWAVFQPNAEPLWNALTQEVNAFMLTLFRANYFQGDTPSEAFLVQCDNTTTTQDDINNGVVNILVGFAPLKPAEFVVIQISQLAGQSQS